MFAFTVLAEAAAGQDPIADRLMRDRPPTLYVKAVNELNASQAEWLSRKHGHPVDRLTEALFVFSGRTLQANVVGCPSKADAEALAKTLAKKKQIPLEVVVSGRQVVEYVARDRRPLDEPLLRRLSWELGAIDKPTAVRYRVAAGIVPVDEADGMLCQVLSNFLVNRVAAERLQGEIADISPSFVFGNSLALRNPLLERATHVLKPAPMSTQPAAGRTDPLARYRFGDLPKFGGVPYVAATIELTVDDSGFRRAETASAANLEVTDAWPADDPEIGAYAKKVVGDAKTPAEKVARLLTALKPRPSYRFRYGGPVGARHGVKQMFAQKFGRCFDFSDMFITLARAEGIPARQVAGWLYGQGGHVWAEWYDEENPDREPGWQQVDPTGGGLVECGVAYIPYFTSEDGSQSIVYAGGPPTIVVLPLPPDDE